MRRVSTISDSIDWTVERGDDAIEIQVHFNMSRYIPAKIWGPPEDCYPAEGGAVEDIWARKDGRPFYLTEEEEREVITWIEENYNEDYQ